MWREGGGGRTGQPLTCPHLLGIVHARPLLLRLRGLCACTCQLQSCQSTLLGEVGAEALEVSGGAG